VAQLIVISHFQTRPLLKHRGVARGSVAASPDLGLTDVEVVLEAEGVVFPSGELLHWEAVEEVSAAENNCFVLDGGKTKKVIVFSELTNRVYSLLPTEEAPTMLVSGIPMHRIKGTTPNRDTLEKMRAVSPVEGQVLDTATGLGYTAMEAAKRAEQVVTIELDPAVLEVARVNPWSRGLFNNPRIRQRIGDSNEVIKEFEDGAFSCIIHDPPMMSLAGELYGRAFYAELYRVLKRGGRLFHYVGDPESRSGASVTRGVVERLKMIGFKRVERRPEAFGVVAFK
jgi:predicted methyltransferase